MQQRGIQVTTLSLDTAPPVMADRTLLRQALLNLLSHALDTLTSQGELLISATEGDGNVHFYLRQAPIDNAGHEVQAPLPA